MAEGSPPHGGFLPPEPHGPEPDLAARPAPPPAPPAAAQPPGQGYAPPAQEPPAQWAPTPGQASADNGPAVLGFSLSLSSVGLLLISGGLSTLISIGLAIPGMLQSRKGTRRVRDGLTTRNAGLAKAGWVIGIVALVLSVLATIIWTVFAVLVATNEGLRDDFERELERELDQYEQSSAAVTALFVAGRVIGAALS